MPGGKDALEPDGQSNFPLISYTYAGLKDRVKLSGRMLFLDSFGLIDDETKNSVSFWISPVMSVLT